MGIVERRITGFLTKDFLGLFDVLCWKATYGTPPGYCCVGIQATSHTNHVARVKKLQAASDTLRQWADLGNVAWVVSWHPKRAIPRVEEIHPVIL